MFILLLALASAVLGSAEPTSDTREPSAIHEMRRMTIGGGLRTSTGGVYALTATVGEVGANLRGDSGNQAGNSGFWAGSRTRPEVIFVDNFGGDNQ